MHAFCGEHLLVFDAFGLTRVTLPTGKVKTNKKVVGQFAVANGGLVIGHSVPMNKRFALTVPELKVLPIDDKLPYALSYGFSLAVAPDDTIIDASEGLGVFSLDAGPRGKASKTIDTTNGTALFRIDLGPPLVGEMYGSNRIAIGPDGTFVVHAGSRSFGGKGKVTWHAPTARPQGQLHMRAGAWGAFVSTFQPARGEAICVLIANNEVTRRTVACIGPVDFDGTRIVFQSSSGEVCRQPIRGGEADRFGLPASAHGHGAVMADGDHLLFLTPDHERILDLANDDAFERGLAEAERANRAKLIAFVDRFRLAANAANLDLRLAAMCPPAYGAGPRPQWSWDEGDEGVLRNLVIGNLLTEGYADPELSAGSYSHMGALAPVTAASIERAFAVLDAEKLSLMAGLFMLASPLGDYWHPKRGKPNGPRFDTGASRMMLHAIVACRRTDAQPPLAPNARTWVDKPLRPAGLIASLDPSKSWSAGRMSDAQTAALYLVLDHFGADALPVFLDWMIARPNPNLQSNLHIFATPLAALVKHFPAAKPGLDAALAKAAADPERKQTMDWLRTTIASELGS